jgi:hypothetical protein
MASRTKETSDHTPHLRVRIDPRLLERLEKSREKSGRTLTGEIVHRIEQSFLRDDTLQQSILIAETTGGRVAKELYKRYLENRDVRGQGSAEEREVRRAKQNSPATPLEDQEWPEALGGKAPWIRQKKVSDK